MRDYQLGKGAYTGKVVMTRWTVNLWRTHEWGELA
jgi:hypothetical protein